MYKSAADHIENIYARIIKIAYLMKVQLLIRVKIIVGKGELAPFNIMFTNFVYCRCLKMHSACGKESNQHHSFMTVKQGLMGLFQWLLNEKK